MKSSIFAATGYILLISMIQADGLLGNIVPAIESFKKTLFNKGNGESNGFIPSPSNFPKPPTTSHPLVPFWNALGGNEGNINPLNLRYILNGLGNLQPINPFNGLGSGIPWNLQGNFNPFNIPKEWNLLSLFGNKNPFNLPGDMNSLSVPGNGNPLNLPGNVNPLSLRGNWNPFNSLGNVNPLNLPGNMNPLNFPGNTNPLNFPGNVNPLNFPGNANPFNLPTGTNPLNVPGLTNLLNSFGISDPLSFLEKMNPSNLPGSINPSSLLGINNLLNVRKCSGDGECKQGECCQKLYSTSVGICIFNPTGCVQPARLASLTKLKTITKKVNITTPPTDAKRDP